MCIQLRFTKLPTMLCKDIRIIILYVVPISLWPTLGKENRYLEQAKKSEWDYKLDPVYSIGILDFIFDDHRQDKELLHIVELKNQRCEVFYNKLKFIYLELPKFKKEEKDLKTHFDKWVYVLTHLSKLQDRPKKLQERIFAKLFEEAEIAKFTPEEWEAYEDSLKYYRDIKNVVDTSREEGKEEERNDIAKEMKNNGEPIEKIIKYTNLTKKEIENL